eukprot:gnl/Spiro4/21015_TR10245_c0_g1_i1.p2 gnl/Spiro4/21015_TR10245_c0_g1~~gnl/Spiro4/21015_TR10245_c0_g1_i1.p2  ORF type:complete len:129 (+),score=32.72 gnl/Spiro4/21015_TR10245_c0_g1_i1:201-587(+)
MTHTHYELYRRSTLGTTLGDTLDELILNQQITPGLAHKVLKQFDKSINEILAARTSVRCQFKGHLQTYRFCDNVWTFELTDSHFRIDNDSIQSGKVKIVACDGKMTQNPALVPPPATTTFPAPPPPSS